MGTIFEDCPKEVIDFSRKVLNDNYPELSDVRYTVLYDVSGKKHRWLAKIYKANEMLRFFTGDVTNTEDGLDYIIVLDAVFYKSEVITDEDRMRLFRHEFRHIMYDPEKKTRKGQYKLRKHNLESFYEEIALNTAAGEPRWEEKMSEIYFGLFEQEGEE